MANKSYTYRDFIYTPVSSNGVSRDVQFISPEGKVDRVCVYCTDEAGLHKGCQAVIDNRCRSRVYNLHSNFDVLKHKETYINYLEVIIMPTGQVSYAVPSHTQKLEEIVCQQRNISHDDLKDIVPREYWLDYTTWLLEVTGCISVWTNFYLGKANEYQLDKLKELKDAGVYCGELEPGYSN